MRKQILSVSVAAVASLLLVACGGSDNTSSATSTGTTTSSTTTSKSTSTNQTSAPTSSAEESEPSTDAAPADSSGGGSNLGAVGTTAIGINIPAPDGFDPLGTGEVFEGAIMISPSNVADLDDNYAVNNGQVNLDFNGLGELSADKTVNVYVNNGQINATLPNNIPVEVSCKGSASCNAAKYNEGTPGKTLKLNLEVNSGQVSVSQP